MVFDDVCEAIVPRCEFAYDRMMSKGDANCHWVVRKKTGHDQEKTKEDTPKIVRI